MFSTFRNCPRSAIQAQEEKLDPCCEPYAQPSLSLAFFTGSKKAWDWMSNDSLQSHSLAAFSYRGGQSVITHFCVDKLSELQISLVDELAYFGHYIDFDETRGEFTFSWNLLNWFQLWTRDWIRFSTKKLFLRRDSIQNTCNVNMIHLLTLFWNNFLNLKFFSS